MKLRMAVFAAGLALGRRMAPRRLARGAQLDARRRGRPRSSRTPPSPAAASGAWRRPSRQSRASTPSTSGYAGGQLKNPTYEQVSSGSTGHAESVQVAYDPAQVSYEQLLEVFWHNVDPTDGGGQFCDRGNQYRSAIFYENEAQKTAGAGVEARARGTKRFGKPIVTQIVPLEAFYPAEEYHQDFYKKNPVRYHMYRTGCGRDRRLAAAVGQGRGRPRAGRGRHAATARGKDGAR